MIVFVEGLLLGILIFKLKWRIIFFVFKCDGNKLFFWVKKCYDVKMFKFIEFFFFLNVVMFENICGVCKDIGF